jgi:hypothetical protein
MELEDQLANLQREAIQYADLMSRTASYGEYLAIQAHEQDADLTLFILTCFENMHRHSIAQKANMSVVLGSDEPAELDESF